MNSTELYAGKEQSQVKHEVLKRYLERFAQIIFTKWDSITYIDGFSGPWNSVSADLRDSSFAIAERQLRVARASHAQRGRAVRARCYFVEEDPTAFSVLQDFASKQTEVEINCRNSSFEDSISAILKFIREASGTFAFTLIDPTGWTGFALDRIRPLLVVDPGEVLVNFMTGHITRFIDVPAVRPQLVAMFGSEAPLKRISGLRGLDRTDACVDEYCEVLKRAGNFEFACPAMILQPTRDRPHFHLIYATRSPRGLDVFKDAERKAMDVMEQARASAEQRHEISEGQLQLFDAKEMPPSQFYFELRRRYLGRARTDIEGLLKSRRRMPYDDAWRLSLKQPLVWESDLKTWVKEWQKAGNVDVEGMGPRQRVPQHGQSLILVWKTP